MVTVATLSQLLLLKSTGKIAEAFPERASFNPEFFYFCCFILAFTVTDQTCVAECLLTSAIVTVCVPVDINRAEVNGNIFTDRFKYVEGGVW